MMSLAIPAVMPPRQMAKQEFGNRLYQLILARGWTQSELARQAGLPRDRVSAYVRGAALPTASNLNALARAFGMEPEALLPHYAQSHFIDEDPDFEMTASTSSPGKALLRINRIVSFETAVKIASLLNEDKNSRVKPDLDEAPSHSNNTTNESPKDRNAELAVQLEIGRAFMKERAAALRELAK